MKRSLSIIFVLFVLGFSKAQLSSSLVACYPLNGDATDEVSAFSGTLHSVSATTDRGNNSARALAFTGTSSCYVEIASKPNLKSSEMSISGWFKPTLSGPAQYAVFTKNTMSSNFEAYSLVVSGQGAAKGKPAALSTFVGIKGAAGVVDQVNSTTTVTSGQWYHVAVTFNSTTIKMYVNGVLEATTASTIVPDYDAGKGIILGGSNETNFNLPYSGSMDNLRIYNRALSATEVSDLYTQDPACVTAPPPPPVATSIGGQVNTIAGVNMFPNPVSTKLTIENMEGGELYLYDVMGKLLTHRTIDENATEIDMSFCPAGIYVLNFVAEGKSLTKKIVKE